MCYFTDEIIIMFPLPTAFQNDPDIHHFIKNTGPCLLHSSPPLSHPPSLYDSLVKSVAGQQLNNKVALIIFQRLCTLNTEHNSRPPSPEQLLSLSDDTLRQCGLSLAKINTLRRVALARQEGVIPSFENALTWEDSALIEHLTSLKGIGRWTVDMLLIFTLRRPDIMPAHDLGVQEGWRRLKKRDKRPTPATLSKETACFSPARSILTWYCWEAKAQLPASNAR